MHFGIAQFGTPLPQNVTRNSLLTSARLPRSKVSGYATARIVVAVIALPQGRSHRSKRGCARLVEQQRAIVLQHLPFPMLYHAPNRIVNIFFVGHHDHEALMAVHFDSKERANVSTVLHSTSPTHVLAILILVNCNKD